MELKTGLGDKEMQGGSVRHPIDTAVMFTALWALASMTIDLLTPKELTAVMVGAAIAPAMLASALLYYLRFPLVDFTVMFATLWLLAAMAIEWISPKQLSPYLILGAFVPGLGVGIWLRAWPEFRRERARQMAAAEAAPVPGAGGSQLSGS